MHMRAERLRHTHTPAGQAPTAGRRRSCHRRRRRRRPPSLLPLPAQARSPRTARCMPPERLRCAAAAGRPPGGRASSLKKRGAVYRGLHQPWWRGTERSGGWSAVERGGDGISCPPQRRSAAAGWGAAIRAPAFTSPPIACCLPADALHYCVQFAPNLMSATSACPLADVSGLHSGGNMEATATGLEHQTGETQRQRGKKREGSQVRGQCWVDDNGEGSQGGRHGGRGPAGRRLETMVRQRAGVERGENRTAAAPATRAEQASCRQALERARHTRHAAANCSRLPDASAPPAVQQRQQQQGCSSGSAFSIKTGTAGRWCSPGRPGAPPWPAGGRQHCSKHGLGVSQAK